MYHVPPTKLNLQELVKNEQDKSGPSGNYISLHKKTQLAIEGTCNIFIKSKYRNIAG